MDIFDDSERRRTRILAIFAVLLAGSGGCGGHTSSETEDAAGEAGPASDAATSDVFDDQDATIPETGVDTVAKDITPKDITVDSSPDRDVSGDGGRNCASLIVGQRQRLPPAGVCDEVDAAMLRTTYACLPPPPSGMSCDDAYELPCVLSTYACGIIVRADTILCGPVSDSAGDCCYFTQGGCAID